MANYSELHQTINDNIKPNGNQQITGQVLQNVLNAIVDSLAEGYLFAGVATADGNPGSLDQNAWWLAGPGTYANYGNITVAEGKLAALMWDGEWSSSTVDVGGVIKAGTGIKLDESGAIAIDLVAGDFISIEGNKISCTLDANPFYFTDALPETPVPGTENKVYVVPNSEGTGYDLYQWDAETSAFNKVGSISFTFDPSDFVKKNEVNEATGPTTLSADAAYQLGLRNTTSRSAGVDFDNGAGEGKNMLQVRSKAGNPATDSYMQMLLNGGNNVLTFGPDGLAVGGPSGSNLVKLMYIIQAPDEIYWTNIGATFTISGLFNLIKSQGNAIAYGLRNPNGKTIYDAIAIYIPGADDINQQITLQFFAAGNMCSAFVTLDDTVTIASTYNSASLVLDATTYCPIARKWTGVYENMSNSGLFDQVKKAIATGATIYLKDASGMYMVDYLGQDVSGIFITYKVPISRFGYGIMHISFNISTGAFTMLPRGGKVVLYGNEMVPGYTSLWTSENLTSVSIDDTLYIVITEAAKFNCEIVLCNQAFNNVMDSYAVSNVVINSGAVQLDYFLNWTNTKIPIQKALITRMAISILSGAIDVGA